MKTKAKIFKVTARGGREFKVLADNEGAAIRALINNCRILFGEAEKVEEVKWIKSS